MKKKVPHAVNVRTGVVRNDGKYSVKDGWPPVSRLWKHYVTSCIMTEVTAGKIYVEQHPPNERPTTTIYTVGESFAQEPGIVYLIGSVLGGETVSVSDDPIPLEVMLEPAEVD